jgi:choline dehydrogenase-like flavoprotein
MRRAIVVGSGASGATVARLLARSGNYSVLVLEKGRNYFSGLGGDTARVSNIFANDELAYEIRLNPVNQDPILEPRSFRYKPEDGKRKYIGDVNDLPTAVGGGTIHYDAKARRFREVDFVTNSLMGGNAGKPAISGTTYADWPMQYRHLEPFYAVIEEIVGVQGPAHRDRAGKVVNPNPYESWRSTPFPLPPGVAMFSNLIQADAARRLGYFPAAVPTAVVSRPYRGRPACNDCAHCLSFGCPTNAKSGGVWQLNDALQTGRVELRSECNVIRIEVDPVPAQSGRHRARGVTYVDANGNRHTELGDLVVLANTPIEATRLSLLSGIGALPDDHSSSTLGRRKPASTEPSGLLGRNLMFHLQTFAIGIFNQSIHSWRGRTSTHCLDAFVGAGPSAQHFDASVPRGGIVELGGNTDPITEASDMAPFGFGASHKQLMRLSPFRRHLAAFTMQGEDMPQVTNCVDLDPDIVDVFGQQVPRITYQSHQYELEAAAYYIPKMLEIMGAIGGPGSPWPDLHTIFTAPLGSTFPAVDTPDIVSLVSSAAFNPIPQSKHIMGTHRMALDQEHGPCNPYGRYWAFDNLYHAGGGLFVTAPGYNVTLTIWALAYWVAAGILVGADQAGSYDTAAIDQNWQRQLEVIRTLDGDTMIARVLSGPSSGAPGGGGGTVGAGVSALPSTSSDRGSGGVAAVATVGALAAAARRARSRTVAEPDADGEDDVEGHEGSTA